ncbi:geranylgeranyl pyrophosphate synthase [Olea europaea subsp. europaea]|uniref:Geranylgeranyl pyrophosphate synthase n=1 Tax=Olea europaea subsp. europaea TaxID=158383 RepID=A0A8S0SLZ0_OLEEU|nr:geranylgeranyl pyrophosphate synthase [Olea europaea subsp. europaea]
MDPFKIHESIEHMTIATKRVPFERIVRVIGELAECASAQGLIGGQVVDIYSEVTSDVGLDQLEFIHIHKTASLLEGSVVSGATLWVNDHEIVKLRKFARFIGLLFQVVDDIHYVEKSSQELGKTAGRDMLADKTTYPNLIGDFAEKLSREAQE